jgi:hypothetical protein
MMFHIDCFPVQSKLFGNLLDDDGKLHVVQPMEFKNSQEKIPENGWELNPRSHFFRKINK